MDFPVLILFFYNLPPSSTHPNHPTSHATPQFQTVHHTIYTSPTRRTKTHHITTPNVTPHRLNDFKTPHFNHYPFLTSIFITYIILTEI